MVKTFYPSFVFLFIATSLNAQTLVNQTEVDTLGYPVTSQIYQLATSDTSHNTYFIQDGYMTGQQSVYEVAKVHNGLIWVTAITGAPGTQTFGLGICQKGNYVYTTGYSQDSTNSLKSAMYTVKLNKTTGDTMWTRAYRGAFDGYNSGAALAADDSGNVYVVGTEQTAATEYSMDLIKYDSSGNRLWVSGYDSSGLYSGGVAIAINSGNVSITGASGTAFASWDFCTAWFDFSGNRLSVARSGNGNGNFSRPVGIIRTDNGGIVVVGTAATTGVYTNIKLVEYDSTFAEQWVTTYGDSGSYITATQASDDDNGHYIISGSANNSSGGTDMLAVTYNHSHNSSPTLNWVQTISAPNRTQPASATAITTDDNGNIILAGKAFNNGHWDMVTNVMDINSGSLLWQKTYKRTSNTDDSASAVVFDGTDICVYGTSAGTTDTIYDVVKYEQLPVSMVPVYDTSGMPLYAEGNLIMRFDRSVLNLDFVNNGGLIFGTLDDVLSSSFKPDFESKLGQLGIKPADCYLQKLAPNYSTSDRFLISTIGDTVKIPPFWSSFLLIYPSLGNEIAVRDSLLTLFPNIVAGHLNSLGITSSCNCSTLCANDSLYSQQFGLHDDSLGTYTNGNVNVEPAWAVETGKTFVRVGIFDTGIRWGHEDFKHANDFSSNVKGGHDYTVHEGLDLLMIPSDSADFSGHGTQIAGIIGAVRDNEKGIAGIAGGNYCNIPTLDNLGVSLYGFDVDYPGGGPENASVVSSAAVIMAMNNALSNNTNIAYSNMNILNCSFNIYSSDTNFQEFKEKYYYAFRLGKTVVGSRGNIDANHTHGDEISYPASFPDDWVICVGGSNEIGDESVGSGPGSVSSMSGYPVDIIAPFKSIMNFSTDLYSVVSGQQYTNSKTTGTSFSAPYASGLAVLLLSHLNNPNGLPDPANLVVEDVEHMAQQKAYYFYNYPPPYNIKIGWGRIDMGASVNMADTTHAHILHFNSANTSTTSSITKVSGADVILKLLDPFPVDTIPTLTAKTYKAEVWKLTDVVHHNIVLQPGTNVIAGWARSSSSNCYGYYERMYNPTTTDSDNILEPYEKAYMDSSIAPDSNSATIWGYFYLIKDSLNPTDTLGWIPTNPFDTLHPPKLSYTIYIDTVNSIILGGEYVSIKSDFLFITYPNPATNNLHVNLKGEEDNYNISIITSLGQPVKQLFEGKTNALSADYNISNLESGLYYIQVISSKKHQVIKLSIIK